MSRKAEDLEMLLESQKLEAEQTVSAVRDFWRNKVFERSTRGGMMLMAAARGIVRQFDSYLEN